MRFSTPGPPQLHPDRTATLVGTFERSPAYLGLSRRLRSLIADGRLPVSSRLPSERLLCEALGVSRTTVTRAYDDLREQGYLVSVRGSGTTVSLPHSRAHRGDHVLSPQGSESGFEIDLTVAAGPAGAGVLAAFERAVAELPGHLAGTGYYPSGLPLLREAIAARYAARGLPTSPEQVLVVPGALAGLAITQRALLARGQRVLVESPTYPNAIEALAGAGLRVTGLDVGPAGALDEGWDVASWEENLARLRPAAAYLVPDHHNPTGATMPIETRERIARAAARAGTRVIVDETLSELTLEGAVPPPFAGFGEEVVSLGSLSKPVWGGLRVGWVRAPRHLFGALLRGRLALDLGVPVVEQMVAAELITDLDAHLRDRLAFLRSTRDALRTAIAERLPQWRPNAPRGGLSLWVELPGSSATLVRAAEREGVLLAPGSTFAPAGGLDRFLRIPFALPPERLIEAVDRLTGLGEIQGARGRTPTMVA